MAHSQCAITDTAGNADELDIGIGIGTVHLALLVAPGGEEAGRGGCEGLLATGSQTGGDAHQILLGDSHLYGLLREGVEEGSQTGRAPGIGAQNHNILVGCCLFHQHIADGLTIGNFIHGEQPPSGRQNPR